MKKGGKNCCQLGSNIPNFTSFDLGNNISPFVFQNNIPCKGHIQNSNIEPLTPSLNPLAGFFLPAYSAVTTEAIIENYPMYGDTLYNLEKTLNQTLGDFTTTMLSTLNATPSIYDLSTPALSILSNTEITSISVLNTREECFRNHFYSTKCLPTKSLRIEFLSKRFYSG